MLARAGASALNRAVLPGSGGTGPAGRITRFETSFSVIAPSIHAPPPLEARICSAHAAWRSRSHAAILAAADRPPPVKLSFPALPARRQGSWQECSYLLPAIALVISTTLGGAPALAQHQGSSQAANRFSKLEPGDVTASNALNPFLRLAKGMMPSKGTPYSCSKSLHPEFCRPVSMSSEAPVPTNKPMARAIAR